MRGFVFYQGPSMLDGALIEHRTYSNFDAALHYARKLIGA